MNNRLARPIATVAAAVLCAALATTVQADGRPAPRDAEMIVPASFATAPDISTALPKAAATSPRPAPRPAGLVRALELPDLRWDHVDGSSRWTRAAMQALESHGDRLVETVPRDIEQWCPAYVEADEWGRKAFWAGLLSTLSKHESTYRPHAVGGGGLWYGLVQILPATARGYGCRARTGEALKDGALNMSCAVRIMNVTVPRDGVVARGMRGVAADWGPFHSTRKREDMRRWLVRQPFCNGLHRSARPVERPDWLGVPPGDAQEVPTFVAWELDKQVLAGASSRGAFAMAADD
jgi:hypothetical protein